MNVILMLSFLACEEKVSQDKPKNISKPLEIEYHPPLLPQKGLVLMAPISLGECLEELPSCQCDSIEEGKNCYPQFTSEVLPIPHLMQEKMRGVSWIEDCPVPLEDLRLLRILHWTETDRIQWGELIFHKGVVKDAQKAFAKLYEIKFPIHQIEPAHLHHGSDDESMVANNTVAFNCRKSEITKNWSEHSYGEAVDINPLWNPWVRGEKVLPEEARAFADRTNLIPGMINDGDQSVEIMKEQGWIWGSQKSGIQSYQNFSRQNPLGE